MTAGHLGTATSINYKKEEQRLKANGLKHYAAGKGKVAYVVHDK
jgi:hypothetical protein